jgi:hypothetical protein
MSKVVKTRAKVSNVRELEKLGLGFSLKESQKLIESTGIGGITSAGRGTGMGAVMEKPLQEL